MGGMLAKELRRSISSSLGRFLALAGIVALGCGFYAGLRMTGPDMRLAADAFYDGTKLNDIRVLSSMGFDDEQLDAIAQVEGVDQVMAGKAADVMCLFHDERYVMRIMSLDVETASLSTVDDQGIVVKGETAYLNRLVLAEGSWPTGPNECVLSADREVGKPIRTGDIVEVLYGTDSLDDVLQVRSFRVSGTVHSSAFPSNAVMGYTNLGSGILQQYMFVSKEAFSPDLPYTELFVSVASATPRLAGSSAYQREVDAVVAKIEALSDDLAASRLASVREEAQAEIDDAQVDYDEQSASARAELEEEKKKLDAAFAELQDAMRQIESGQASYDEGKAELASARARAASELAAGRRRLDEATAELDAAERQLGMDQAAIDHARSEFESGRKELEQGREQWQEQRAQLLDADTKLATVASAVNEISSLVSQPSPTPEQLAAVASSTQKAVEASSALQNLGFLGDEAKEAMGSASSMLAGVASILTTIDPTLPPEDIAAQLSVLAGQADAIGQSVSAISQARESIETAILEGDTNIASTQQQLDESASKLDEAQAARTRIDEGRRELAQGWETLRSQEERAASELASAQARLDAAAAELSDARTQLSNGQKEYEEGVEELKSASAEVDARLADAAAQLASARADVEALEPPDIYVLDRTKNVGVASYQADSERIDAIARVFPAMFFLVAALVALTTMTRMVEDERTEIGTHKALGFSTAQITTKYVAYAALAAILGSTLGIALLSQVLPIIIQIAYAIMYNIPIPQLPLPIDMPIALQSAGLGIGVTIFSTWAAAATTLTEVPATLMLPRAPKPGKRILLEHIRPVWDRVSFSWKVSLRNLFRYKRRFAMTIIGIAGCTALLLTGLGLHDSIWDIIDCQYEGQDPIMRYNVVVGLSDDAEKGASERVREMLSSAGDASEFAMVHMTSMQISSEAHPATLALNVVVPDDSRDLTKLIAFRNRVTRAPVELTEDSVILTEKMAGTLGVGVGDVVRIYEQDDIGNATGSGYEFRIDAIVENYVLHYLYVGKNAWELVCKSPATPDTILTEVGEGEQARLDVAHVLEDDKDVSIVEFNTEVIDSYRKSLRSVNMIVVVLVVAAAALAFIVLYNLANINIIERLREIASLKVLGFTRYEVATYVFREIGLLVVMGSLLGLGLGTLLEGFVAVTAEVDAVMFGRTIHPPSYVMAFALTLVFSALVMAAMLPKLRRIDMVESLKSVD